MKWISNSPMRFMLVLAMVFTLAALPVSAQIQYFGYVGGADDDQALRQTKGFTNFAHLSADNYLPDPFIKNRVSAMAPLGIKAVIDLGKVLWCDYDGTGRYLSICGDWVGRWSQWKAFNASILTPDQVLAFSIRDEPFNYNVSMYDFEQAAALVKSDLPWAKLFMVEAACVVATDNCGWFPGSGAVAQYGGTLRNIDWIGLDDYGIYPKTDTTFQQAVNIFRSKFPGKKWIYVLDGYYDSATHACFGKSEMPGLGQAWFTVASTDPDAILAGVFLFPDMDVNAIGSASLGADVMEKHAHIGQAIQNRKAPAYQSHLENANCQTASGWAWDSNQTDSSLLGSQGYITNPAYLDLIVDSNFVRTFSAKLQQSTVSADPVVGNGFHGFSVPLPDIAKNGVPHTVHIRISGTTSEIPGSPRQVTCSNPSGYPGTQLANGSVNVPYSQSIWPFPNPQDFSFSLISGRLPGGLSINSSGVITGTPTASGSFLFSVRASLAGQQGSCSDSYTNNLFDRVFTIAINP
jgi:hypothetical protein